MYLAFHSSKDSLETVIESKVIVALLALVTLAKMTQIQIILIVLCHPR
jgi:hypothetical protein